jgi:serine phosphatase RsbU (regulator of sigma subunit)
MAVGLQGSLLPTLPRLAGISSAARYLAGGPDAQVGGDWYDLFALPDGAIGVAVGDVMGHDVAAAAEMGQLRSVLRSYAYEGSSPSTVLDRLDRLVQAFDMAQLATAVYAG